MAKTVKVTTKVIGVKAYNALAIAAYPYGMRETEVSKVAKQTLNLTYCNLDSPSWGQWQELGMNIMQITKLEDKIQDLADDTWLVVTVAG